MFSICARLPLGFAILSGSALIGAIASIMFDRWPALVLAPCIMFAFVLTIQYVGFCIYRILNVL